jgi:ABC-2 type transport system ATP-binding protein
VFLDGLNPSDPAARRTLGYLPEDAAYPKFLTPRELLRFYGRLSGVDRAALDARMEKLFPLVGLEHAADRRLGTFSNGMVQKVGLLQALIHDPQILVLDEPTSGLDPVAKLHLRETLRGLQARGKTIFFSSHELSEVELLCDSVAILSAGKILRSGPLSEVVGDGERNLERLFVRLIGESAR